MSGFFVDGLAFFFVAVLVVTVDYRVRNVSVQDLRYNGYAERAGQEASH